MFKKEGKYFKMKLESKDEVWLLSVILASLYDDGYREVMVKIGREIE